MSLSKQDRRMQRLDLMSYREKSIRWKRKDPLGTGVGLTTGPNLKPEQVATDGRGNIQSISAFVRKPCFGIPTAWLRHAHQPPTYVNRLDQWIHNGRCDRCLASEACEKVAIERVKWVARTKSDFRRAFKAWKDAGGLERSGFEKALAALGEKGWSAVCYPLDTASFSTVNEPHVRAFWQMREAEAAKKAKGKERFRLREAWKAGEELNVLREGLTGGAKERASLLLTVIKGPETPKYLAKFPKDSITRICNVWWSREFAHLTGRPINDSQVASIAIDQGRIGISHSSLRQMVKKDRARIKKLESAAGYNGGTPIWPKFIHPALA